MSNLLRRAIERVGQFVFNLRSATYSQDGRAVPSTSLLDTLSGRIADASSTNRNLTSSFLSGSIDLATWRKAVAVELRRATWQAYTLGRGGWQQIESAERAAMTRRMKSEFQYLRRFTDEIAAGKLSSAEIQERIDMYAEHLRAPFYEGLREANENAGKTRERRVMGIAEHCDDCEGYASEGWQEIGYFPPPGDDSRCLSNCKCEMEWA